MNVLKICDTYISLYEFVYYILWIENMWKRMFLIRIIFEYAFFWICDRFKYAFYLNMNPFWIRILLEHVFHLHNTYPPEYVSPPSVFSLNMYLSEYVYFLNMNILLFQKRFLFEYIYPFRVRIVLIMRSILWPLRCMIASVYAIEPGNDHLFSTKLLLTQ